MPKLKLTIIVANSLFIIALILFITSNTHSAQLVASTNSLAAADINPLDQATSADIAQTVAAVSNLPEYTAVSNQAQTAAANQAIATLSDNIVVTKPEIVTTALKSKADIFYYVTKPGDSVSSLSQKFGVTSNSIMWSNGLTSNSLTAGQRLVIPPVNAIVYTVKTGDTPASLAQKFNANEQQIIAYNDAQIAGIKPGEQVIIPNGQIQTQSTYANYSFSPTYGYNGYDYGYCTWYVATQIPVPSNWGNASSWAYYATLSGWNVSTTPTIGSIAQTAYAAGGQGHVGIVEAIKGSQVEIRDMNYLYWDVVSNHWTPIASFQHYITP